MTTGAQAWAALAVSRASRYKTDGTAPVEFSGKLITEALTDHFAIPEIHGLT